MAFGKITPRWFLGLAVNSLALSMIVALVFNFSYAPWSWDPIEDLLYVRSVGPILAANHISSALAVAGTVFIFAARDFDHAARWTFIIFSTVSIHEFILDAMNIPAFLAAHTLGYTITFRWFFWLSFFLIPGVVLASRAQRRTLLDITVFCFVYIGSWVALAELFNVDTFTILAYAPGPAYHDLIPNFFEVSSWIIPTSFWWFRR